MGEFATRIIFFHQLGIRILKKNHTHLTSTSAWKYEAPSVKLIFHEKY